MGLWVINHHTHNEALHNNRAVRFSSHASFLGFNLSFHEIINSKPEGTESSSSYLFIPYPTPPLPSQQSIISKDGTPLDIRFNTGAWGSSGDQSNYPPWRTVSFPESELKLVTAGAQLYLSALFWPLLMLKCHVRMVLTTEPINQL